MSSNYNSNEKIKIIKENYLEYRKHPNKGRKFKLSSVPQMAW